MGDVHQGSMVRLEKYTPQGPRPPPGFPTQVSEMASSSQGEPPPVPGTSTPELAADPGPTARCLMVHINQMVDLMLADPLAQYCEDEAFELFRQFTVLHRPK